MKVKLVADENKIATSMLVVAFAVPLRERMDIIKMCESIIISNGSQVTGSYNLTVEVRVRTSMKFRSTLSLTQPEETLATPSASFAFSYYMEK